MSNRSTGARRSGSAAHGVRRRTSPTRWRAPSDALAWLRARHADGSLPLLRLPAEARTISPRSRDAARRLAARRERHRAPRHRRIEPRRPDAGAARRPRACRASARCAIRRACTSWTISIPRPTARCSQQLPLATTRFVAISKSGGTGETLMQTTAALAAVKAAGLARAHPGTVPRPHRARQGRQAQRPARAASTSTRSPMLDHDPGVGGRYSVLTNVGLLPAARARPRHRARSATAPRQRSRRCSTARAPARGPGRGRRGARGRAGAPASRSR